MKKFFLVLLYTFKHILKMLLIIGISWVIAAGILWFIAMVLEIEAGLVYIICVALGLIAVAAMEAHTEVTERLKEQELASELENERRNRFFMEN